MSGSNQASLAAKTPLKQSIVTKNKIPTVLTLSSSISSSTYRSSLGDFSNRSVNHQVDLAGVSDTNEAGDDFDKLFYSKLD